MNPGKLIFVFAMLLPLLTGCGEAGVPSIEKLRSLNEIKLITPSVTEPNEPSCYSQDRYKLSSDRRLLARFDELKDHRDGVRTHDGAKVGLDVAIPDGTDMTQAQAGLRLCPITKNWMMLATWTAAHPWGGGGWAKAGGDIDGPACVMAATVTDRILHFDVTRWFVDYIKASDRNFGLMFVADRELEVWGEERVSYAPRLIWTEIAIPSTSPTWSSTL